VLSLAPAITAAAQAFEIDPLLLHAIAHVESRHRAGAVSPAGARGVMQVMPDTARRFGVGDPERALLDPDTNLRASAAYLRRLLERYGSDLRLVLAAYNAGEGAVQKHGNDVPPYPETQAYVRDVLAIHRRLAATFAVTPSGTLVARDASGSPR
jgi:soluble lytic murein transglycosylase-like protein